MPLVYLTPRVSVSRMCTPSRIRFAASVRRISSTIASSERNLGEGERERRGAQPRQVRLQPEDATRRRA